MTVVVAMPVPEGVSWAQAGGFPENYTTAHDALFTQCELGMGERVCVHGAAGGVGTAAVELAVAAGCEVVATVRNEALRPGVAALGATAVDPADFGDHGPFDVVPELVGAGNMPANLKALATGGRIAVIGVGGALAYRYVGRPALATMNAARELARIPQIENRVQNRASFSPPADGVLTQGQVDRYLRAANGIRTDLEVMGADLGARFEALEERNDARAVRDLAIAYAELVRLIVRAKEVQVDFRSGAPMW